MPAQAPWQPAALSPHPLHPGSQLPPPPSMSSPHLGRQSAAPSLPPCLPLTLEGVILLLDGGGALAHVPQPRRDVGLLHCRLEGGQVVHPLRAAGGWGVRRLLRWLLRGLLKGMRGGECEQAKAPPSSLFSSVYMSPGPLPFSMGACNVALLSPDPPTCRMPHSSASGRTA